MQKTKSVNFIPWPVSQVYHEGNSKGDGPHGWNWQQHEQDEISCAGRVVTQVISRHKQTPGPTSVNVRGCYNEYIS